MNMGNGAPEARIEKPKSKFRTQVESLITGHQSLGVKQVNGVKMDIIDAIEAKKVDSYFAAEPKLFDPAMAETKEKIVVWLLDDIFNELKKANPDEGHINQNNEIIRSYLETK